MEEDSLREERLRRINEIKRKYAGAASGARKEAKVAPVANETKQTNTTAMTEQPPADATPAEPTKPMVDMFADSDSESDAEVDQNGASGQDQNGGKANLQAGEVSEKAKKVGSKLAFNQSDWDDADGYYLMRAGEILEDKYLVRGNFGRGVFSSVLMCEVLQKGERQKEPEIVAVKVIRNNPTMRRAAEKEISMLSHLEKVPFVIQLQSSFEHKRHLCLVFHPMKMNLRQVLYQYGKNIGINMHAVVTFGRQLFTALAHLRSKRIVHADLKLDNILVSQKLGAVKLCDFGSAFFEDDADNDPTPYLVSRYYRAPEIILGLKYDPAIDTWALATCLFELYTGNVMFPGKTNNDMLRLMMECKGRFPNRLIRKHISSYILMRQQPHFDIDSLKFRQFQEDIVTKNVVLKLVTILDAPAKSVLSMLKSKAMSADDASAVVKLSALLEMALKPDPAKRVTPTEALSHPFFA